jgi:reactive intermediate/imine deaminase
VKTAILLAGVLLFSLSANGEEQKTAMKAFNPSSVPAPNGYSHAIEVAGGRTIYVSGQIALDANGHVVGTGDIKAQTRQVLENMKSVLQAAGASLDDVVKITVFMTDVSQIAGFREVRDVYFTKTPPTSSLVEVKRLVRPELLIEIDAVAVAK